MRKYLGEFLRFFGYAVVIGAVIAGIKAYDGARAQVWKWSQTAGPNATADPSINWAEGQSPGSVNDSARAMMAALARWRDDISGALTTAGTSAAYTINPTNQPLGSATPANGQMLAFTPHATNVAGATLAVDSGSAFAIQTTPGTAVGDAVLVAGTPYVVKYNSATPAWILQSFFGNPINLPIGGIVVFSGQTIPNSNFIFPAGQCISQATYAAYFALVSNLYGTGCSAGQFKVPDLRGRVVAGLDTMNGTPASRLTTGGSGCDGATQGTGCGTETISLNTGQLPIHTPSGTVSGSVSFTPAGSITMAGSIAGTGGNITVGVTDNHQHNYLIAPNRDFTAGTGTSNDSTVWRGTATAAPTTTTTVGAITAAVAPTAIAAGLTWNQGATTFTGNAISPSISAGFSGVQIGAGNPVPIIQPALVLRYILRVL